MKIKFVKELKSLLKLEMGKKKKFHTHSGNGHIGLPMY